MYISFLAVASHAQGSCGINGKILDLSPILLPLRYADNTTLMAESEVGNRQKGGWGECKGQLREGQVNQVKEVEMYL